MSDTTSRSPEENIKKDLSDMSILVIDDKEDTRSMVRQMLTDMGVKTILEAADGEEGLRMINSCETIEDKPADTAYEKVDIVVCDWNMPERDGLSVLKALRDENKDIPFLMMTGRGDVQSVTLAKGAGVNAYLLKPFSMTNLEAKIRIVSARAGLA